MKCLLCKNELQNFTYWKEREYFQCLKCYSIMLKPSDYVTSKAEKARYEEHNNDVDDKGYQAFVYPIVQAVLNDYGKKHKGLDFGSGTGPVITKLLRDRGYEIDIYDPFFANNKERLKETYDYIVCCEVVEHFHNPRLEFNRLKSMLNPGGSLYIKTELYSEGIDFDSWYYKNDPTHVFIYHAEAMKYIEKQFGFYDMIIEKDMISFRRR